MDPLPYILQALLSFLEVLTHPVHITNYTVGPVSLPGEKGNLLHRGKMSTHLTQLFRSGVGIGMTPELMLLIPELFLKPREKRDGGNWQVVRGPSTTNVKRLILSCWQKGASRSF